MQRVRVLIATAVVALAAASAALAHGDPTAHYLESDPLLTSYEAPPDIGVELQLRGVLDEAAKRGYPIKVVLVGGTGDTGGELAQLEETQAYIQSITAELDGISTMRAPVLIITPHTLGVGGRQPRGGAYPMITGPVAAQLLRGIAPPGKADGNAFVRTAIRAIRRLATDGGHPLPDRIAPAKQNLNGILGTPASRDTADWGGRWVIAAIIGATVLLLGGMLIALQRRTVREPEPEL